MKKCDSCIYRDKSEYEKPCIVYSEDCRLYKGDKRMSDMTREEAIGHIKDVICENNTIKPNIVVFEQEKEALYMVIKALEQEPKTDVLDTIRAEIVDMEEGISSYFNDRPWVFKDEVLQIIDKYRGNVDEI